MGRIVPGIASLNQHQQSLTSEPERYRPERCPHCGKARPWSHGSYARKADREGQGEESLNPVAIPRFYCPSCRATCSRLPECVAPHRWYGWAMQQAVLVLLLARTSIRAVSRQRLVSRRTVGRWWRWLHKRFDVHGFHLRSLLPDLGRCAQPIPFWSAALQQHALSTWMGSLDRLGVAVP
jgi:transposase-like protein